jgi:putative ABC transport system ATP-binding protein
LQERLHYKPEALSGGQRQRVAIARALANRPRLILADEPTAALDEKSGRNVVNLLQKLAREEGCTSLIVTHDNRILDVADRIVSLVDGQVKSNVLARESVAVCLFLSRCAAFAGLTPDTLAKVAEKLAKERHPAGSVIFRQGQEGDKFYLIRRGAVDVVQDNGEPGGKVLSRLKEGDFFGEMALLTGEPRSASIVVREDVEAYTLGKADFQNALKTSASFKEQLYKAYFQRQ